MGNTGYYSSMLLSLLEVNSTLERKQRLRGTAK